MASESKYLGAILILVAVVFGGPEIIDQAEALASNGGIWASMPQILQLATMGIGALIVVVTLYLAFSDY